MSELILWVSELILLVSELILWVPELIPLYFGCLNLYFVCLNLYSPDEQGGGPRGDSPPGKKQVKKYTRAMLRIGATKGIAVKHLLCIFIFFIYYDASHWNWQG